MHQSVISRYRHVLNGNLPFAFFMTFYIRFFSLSPVRHIASHLLGMSFKNPLTESAKAHLLLFHHLSVSRLLSRSKSIFRILMYVTVPNERTQRTIWLTHTHIWWEMPEKITGAGALHKRDKRNCANIVFQNRNPTAACFCYNANEEIARRTWKLLYMYFVWWKCN